MRLKRVETNPGCDDGSVELSGVVVNYNTISQRPAEGRDEGYSSASGSFLASLRTVRVGAEWMGRRPVTMSVMTSVA
jgi:hypothetical protein